MHCSIFAMEFYAVSEMRIYINVIGFALYTLMWGSCSISGSSMELISFRLNSNKKLIMLKWQKYSRIDDKDCC